MRNKPIVICGVEYPSRNAASAAIGVSPGAIKRAVARGDDLDQPIIVRPYHRAASHAGDLAEQAEWRRKAVKGNAAHLAALCAAHPERVFG